MQKISIINWKKKRKTKCVKVTPLGKDIFEGFVLYICILLNKVLVSGHGGEVYGE